MGSELAIGLTSVPGPGASILPRGARGVRRRRYAGWPVMSDAALRILAFEPFDTGSHRAVRESITQHSRHAWTWFTLPGRAWKWRMRLGALDLVAQAEAAGALGAPADVIFTTSLLSVADLVAMLPAALRQTPVALYMHENQAAYPMGPAVADDPEAAARDAHFAVTNLTSIATADVTIWNSAWNRDSFYEGIETLLAHAPDAASRRHLAGRQGRDVVVWPPVEKPDAEAPLDRPIGAPIRVVWPHRWEHDKGPDELLEIARTHTEPLNLRWTILGEQFRHVPPAFAEFEREFSGRIDAMGYEPDRSKYREHLARCDWVLSTAQHEFFGIAVVEALLAGCLPWLPDRLSYPELLPPGVTDMRPGRPPEDPSSVRRAIRVHLEPAIARHAVARLDESLADLARRGRQGSGPPRGKLG